MVAVLLAVQLAGIAACLLLAHRWPPDSSGRRFGRVLATVWAGVLMLALLTSCAPPPTTAGHVRTQVCPPLCGPHGKGTR